MALSFLQVAAKGLNVIKPDENAEVSEVSKHTGGTINNINT